MASALFVGVYLTVTYLIEPSPGIRAGIHTFVVLTIGYGHLLASVQGARRTGISGLPYRRWLCVSGLMLAFGFYTHAVSLWAPLPGGLLAVSAWHTIENHRAMRRGGLLRHGGLVRPEIKLFPVTVDLALAGLMSAVVFAVPTAFPPISLADTVAAVTLYHLASWILYALARGQITGRLRSTMRHLAFLHAPPIAVCGLAHFASSTAWSGPPAIDWLQQQVLSPATYLFWSAAHVVHTLRRRIDAHSPPSRRRSG